jgi:hypothetical protein
MKPIKLLFSTLWLILFQGNASAQKYLTNVPLEPIIEPLSHHPIERIGDTFFIVDGTANPVLRKIGRGLIQINPDGTFKRYSRSERNLPTDSVFSVRLFHDTLLISTEVGVFFLEQGEFKRWKGIDYPVFRLNVWKNTLLIVGIEDLLLYQNGSFTNVSKTLHYPVEGIFHADMNDNNLILCYKDSIWKYEFSSKQSIKYRITPYRPYRYRSWTAYLHDDIILVFGASIDNSHLTCGYFIRNDSNLHLNALDNTCNEQINFSDFEPFFIEKESNSIKIHAKYNYSSLYIRISKDQIQFDISENEFLANACFNDEDYVIAREDYNNQSLILFKKEEYLNAIGSGKAKFSSLDRNQILFSVGASNFNSTINCVSIRNKSEDCSIASLGRSLWIGGQNENSELKTAVTRFLKNGNDFFPGPLLKDGSTNSALMNKYNKVWKINKETIDNHRVQLNLYGVVKNIDPAIRDWPVYETYGGDTIQLAKWNDYNKNGYYDPEHGDHPLIKGHQAIYWVMNDNGGIHSESYGQALKVQVDGIAYIYDCFESNSDEIYKYLDHAVFVEYRIVYKGSEKLNNVYMSQWLDADLGNWRDDAIGSAPLFQTAFCINSDNLDDEPLGIGRNPGAQCMTILKGPKSQPGDGIDNDNDGRKDEIDEECKLSGFMGYSNDNSPLYGNPDISSDFYHLMSSCYTGGLPIMKNINGDSMRLRHLFSHGLDPNRPNWHWTQQKSDAIKSGMDQFMLANCGAFELSYGDEVPFHLVHFYVRDRNDSNQLPNILKAVTKLTEIYQGHLNLDCLTQTLNNDQQHVKQAVLNIRPNPAGSQCEVITPNHNGELVVVDLLGNIVARQIVHNEITLMDLSALPNGIYLITHNSSSTMPARLMVLR